MLEQIAYQLPKASEQKQIFYQVGDLESLSASALYYGTSGSGFKGGSFGSISKGEMAKFGIVATPLMKSSAESGSGGGFVPASNFGIGPGIAKVVEGFIERYRAGEHEKFGKDHVNLEYISPVTKKSLINIHIDVKDE
ncbi:MAG: hypothetical protein ABIH65_00765 [Nanoarchaeota archaeon]